MAQCGWNIRRAPGSLSKDHHDHHQPRPRTTKMDDLRLSRPWLLVPALSSAPIACCPVASAWHRPSWAWPLRSRRSLWRWAAPRAPPATCAASTSGCSWTRAERSMWSRMAPCACALGYAKMIEDSELRGEICVSLQKWGLEVAHFEVIIQLLGWVRDEGAGSRDGKSQNSLFGIWTSGFWRFLLQWCQHFKAKHQKARKTKVTILFCIGPPRRQRVFRMIVEGRPDSTGFHMPRSLKMHEIIPWYSMI